MIVLLQITISLINICEEHNQYGLYQKLHPNLCDELYHCILSY